jgi:hypothetical protein
MSTSFSKTSKTNKQTRSEDQRQLELRSVLLGWLLDKYTWISKKLDL